MIMPMADDAPDAVRVALLARPGEVREQIRHALLEMGAELVAEGDPAELDPDHVAQQRPGVVLVSLEPAIEDAVDRFQDLFAEPQVSVVFDDAEVTRLLSGWDLARWARHLAAKLTGRDLLPPLPDGADRLPERDLQPQPGAPETPAQQMRTEQWEDYAVEAESLSEQVPTLPSLTSAPPPPANAAAPVDVEGEEILLEAMRAAQALDDFDSVPATVDDDRAVDPEQWQTLLDAEPDAIDAAMLDAVADDDPDSGVDPDVDSAVDFSAFADAEADSDISPELDADLAALMAQMDAQAGGEIADLGGAASAVVAALDVTDTAPPDDAREPTAPAPVTVASRIDFSALELAPMSAAPAVAIRSANRTDAPVVDFALSDSLTLAPIDTAPSGPALGAIVLIAGLGGPDAVRQFVAALPASLGVPVLLVQHLDAGRHDRLATQLGKAATLPVYLAKSGQPARAGQIAVLPTGIGVSSDGELRFVAVESDAAGLVAALTPRQPVVVALSGADPVMVDAVAALGVGGGLALAQDPATCFDAVAATALQACGVTTAAAADLAALAAARCGI